MDKCIGKELIDATVGLDIGLGKLDDIISRMGEGEMKDRLVRAMKTVFGTLFIDIIQPIVAIYPDLDPDAIKEELGN